MVKNPSNINKTNNYISPQIIEHKKTTTYDVGNPRPGMGQTQQCGELTLLIIIVFQPPLDIWILP